MIEQYEAHNPADPLFPFIFHRDQIDKPQYVPPHWHENVELLFGVRDEALIYADYEPVRLTPGKLAAINCGSIHSISPKDESCLYYCLIIAKSFTDSLGLQVEKHRFHSVVDDERVREIFRRVIRETDERGPFYRQAVKGLATELVVELCRRFSTAAAEGASDGGAQSHIVKQGIALIQRRFRQELTLDSICAEIGYSKYYFCRLFRKYTGRSVMEYLQHYRCEYARTLLRSGSCSVSQSARRCGIPNLSHFSKLYRRCFGLSPREEKGEGPEPAPDAG